MSKVQQVENGAVHSIIFSPTGGTKKVVDILMDNIAGDAVVNEIDLCDSETNFSDIVLGHDDLALIAIPSVWRPCTKNGVRPDCSD